MKKGLRLANVEIKLPPDEELVGALRLFASGLASRLGFNADELEDLKLTISEAFLAIVERSKGQLGTVTVRWEEMPEQLTVRIIDPSRTHTSVATTPIYALLERIADEVRYVENNRELILGFRRK